MTVIYLVVQNAVGNVLGIIDNTNFKVCDTITSVKKSKKLYMFMLHGYGDMCTDDFFDYLDGLDFINDEILRDAHLKFLIHSRKRYRLQDLRRI